MTTTGCRYCTIKNVALIAAGLIISLLAYLQQFTDHRTFGFGYYAWQSNFSSFDDDWSVNRNDDLVEGVGLSDVDNDTTVYIFDWTTFFGKPLSPSDWLAQCPDFNCKFTRDIKMWNRSDAVVFHMRNFDFNNLPKNRLPGQSFVFYLFESPHHTYVNLHGLDSYFNLTISYRKDSDFYLPYGNIRPRIPPADANFSRNLDILVRGKQKLIAWMVGNCRVPSGRGLYVDELRKFLPVDIYGKCGKLQCSDCNKMLDENYKFYLSFENSLCRDYTTEKLFGRMKNYIVPIVLSRKYSSNADLPPHSVIAVDEFCTVKDLADYLKFLDKNHTAYMQYFDWRTRYESGDSFACRPDAYKKCGFCGLCRYLHEKNRTQKILTDPYNWWIKKAECRTDFVPGLVSSQGAISRLKGGMKVCYSNAYWPEK